MRPRLLSYLRPPRARVCGVVGLLVMSIVGVSQYFRYGDATRSLRARAVKEQVYQCGGEGCSRRLLIVQTSDGQSVYKDMLDATAPVHLAYAALHGYGYRRWDGLAAPGDEEWMATFNRIYLLEEAWRRGEYDWVLYIDPDAVVVNATRRADEFLSDEHVMVLAQGGPEREGVHWDVNIGVGFFNLRHVDFPPLLHTWIQESEMCAQYARKKRVRSRAWIENEPFGGCDDQSALQGILQRHPIGAETLVKRYDYERKAAFNYLGGGFIEHYLRSVLPPDMQEARQNTGKRLELLKSCRDRFWATYMQAVGAGEQVSSKPDREEASRGGQELRQQHE